MCIWTFNQMINVCDGGSVGIIVKMRHLIIHRWLGINFIIFIIPLLWSLIILSSQHVVFRKSHHVYIYFLKCDVSLKAQI